MRFKMRFLGKAIVILGGLAALGGVVMLLWNAVIPVAFSGGRLIDYPHALGLLVLSRILFGGFRGHGRGYGRHHWEKWQAMSPEEREKFWHSRRFGERQRGGE